MEVNHSTSNHVYGSSGNVSLLISLNSRLGIESARPFSFGELVKGHQGQGPGQQKMCNTVN